MHAVSSGTIGPDLHPGYRLHRLLGRGGFGQVWAAEGAGGASLALKFLRCAGDLGAVQEIRSIQMVRALSHPNLIRIDRVWSSRGYLIVAMELADGSLLDLLNVCQAELGTAIPPEQLCPLLTQAAEAVDFLNGRRHLHQGQQVGIQHCDVTPKNLLLFGKTVKLSDFSLTSPLAGGEKPHRRAGTPDYAAPEVFRGRLSERTDQYALAVCYCVLRGGRLPFRDTPEGLSPNYLRPPPDLSMVGEVERHVLARALATRPEERWSSCRELMAELTRLTASAPSASRGGRGSERRRGERHRPNADTSCRVLAALGKESWRATVLDLSVGGIRLLIARPNCRLEEGRKLSLVLLNKGRGFGRVVRMRVLHGTELPGGDHILGGTFDGALTEEELTALLEPGPA
jgi:serine/threonine protein kinase